MKASKCCGRCYYAGKPFRIMVAPGIGRLVPCCHPQDHISGTYLDCAKHYWAEEACFWSRRHVFGRVQNRDGSWRPEVPIWALRIGGLFFRLAWKCLSNRTLFKALSLSKAEKPMTLWQRWHMFVIENYAYWDQYDEMSDEDINGLSE